MNEFSNELSENQINYLKQQKKHKCIVGISRILILFSFPGSTVIKLVYKFRMLPKIATDIPATIIVSFVAPSQTIRSGASADFGRLFSTTR